MTYSLNHIQPSIAPIRENQQQVQAKENANKDFSSILKKSIDKVNESQLHSNEKNKSIGKWKN